MSAIVDYEGRRNLNRTNFDFVYYLYDRDITEAARTPGFWHYELVTHEDARFVTSHRSDGSSVALVYLTSDCTDEEALEKLLQVAEE